MSSTECEDRVETANRGNGLRISIEIKMGRLTSEFSELFAKSHELEDEIRKN